MDSRSSQLSFRYSNGTRLDNCRRVPSLLPKKSTATKHLLFFASHETSPHSSSTDILEHYWNVEKIATEPAQKDASSTHDKEALQTLQDTCRHNGKRYEIGLPWKSDSPLPNKYFAALSQLRSLEKRFREHPQKKTKFRETLHKDLEKGYVKQVKMQHPPPPRIWYLPTHPVENPNEPDKVRRVANAASKFKGVSLNNALLTGPDLLANLLEIILLLRKHPVGVLADIEGMFMQVAIREEDQSALRFLWLQDGIIRQYQYARLIFGATCSPRCAIFALHRCAADLSDRFPDVYEAVLNNFYMDDFIMSFATAEAARRLACSPTRRVPPYQVRFEKSRRSYCSSRRRHGNQSEHNENSRSELVSFE